MDGVAEDASWQFVSRRRIALRHRHTGYDLGALEVLVRVQVARRQGKVDAHKQQQEVNSPPHGVCGWDAPCEGCAGVRRRIAVVVVVVVHQIRRLGW
jgi:hypothetical protein